MVLVPGDLSASFVVFVVNLLSMLICTVVQGAGWGGGAAATPLKNNHYINEGDSTVIRYDI